MKPFLNDSDLNPSQKQSTTQAADWNEHEHVCEQVQREAQSLVDQAGSPGLAKMAIEVIEHQQGNSQPLGSREQIASNQNSESPFLESLKNFETTLETPIVSGELMDWSETATHACEELGAILCNELQDKHAELFSRMLKEDNEMGSRVESLRAIDRELCQEDWFGVQRSLNQVFNSAGAVKSDESKVDNQLQKAVELALAFVIKARTQETAISTWFMEAFNRDRGGGD